VNFAACGSYGLLEVRHEAVLVPATALALRESEPRRCDVRVGNAAANVTTIVSLVMSPARLDRGYHRRLAAHHGFRATPPYVEMGIGGDGLITVTPPGGRSGRQRVIDTNPGSTHSSPSKKLAISSG
jgi:hypothetical protein